MLRRSAAALALAALAGCATTPTPQAPAAPASRGAADYYPLAVGNQWTYVGKMLGQPIERTVTLTGVENGYFVDDAGGKGLRVDTGGLRDADRYLLAEPIEKGRTWSSIVSVVSTERYEIADVGVTTSTPAGVFADCVVVRGTNRIDKEKEMVAEWTYAPGVGLVRISTAIQVGGKKIPQSNVELRSFRFPPAAQPAPAQP